MPDSRPVFLIGFMGAGKSVVARALADLLGWDVVDTDRDVERVEGRSIDAIFRESGEGAFRRAEAEALEALDGKERIVVATGGGLFLGAAQRNWMKRRGRTVWLDVSLEIAVKRVGAGEDRPLWFPKDPADFRAFFEKRRAAYALAEARVDGSRGTPEAIAKRVRDKLQEEPRSAS